MKSSLFNIVLSALFLASLPACKFGGSQEEKNNSGPLYHVELYIPDQAAKRPYLLVVPFENFSPDIQEGFVQSFSKPQQADDFNKGAMIWNNLNSSDDSTRILSSDTMIIKLKKQ